jgi:hypothetical protein
MKRLFFIEGVSGVGKSTTAGMLCHELRSRGLAARCYLEGDPDNPVDLFGCAYLTVEHFAGVLKQYHNEADKLLKNSIRTDDYALVRYRGRSADHFRGQLLDWLRNREGFYRTANPVPPDCYTKVFVDCWRRYLGSEAMDEDIAIFDGCLLYHRINDLVSNYDASDQQIIEHLNALLSVIFPHRSYLFYLSAQDVGQRLMEVRKARGDAPVTPERIAVETSRKRRQQAVLEQLPIEKKVFDISDGWDSAIGEMLRIIVDSPRELNGGA